MPFFEIRSIPGLPTAGLLASLDLMFGWLFLAIGIAAGVGFIFSLIAVWRTRTAETREGRGRAIFGVIISWTVLTVVGAGILIPIGCPTPGHPKEVQAQKTATELRTAIMSYYSEYKVFPAVPGATKDSFGDDVLDTRNNLLVEMLLGERAQPLLSTGVGFSSSRPVRPRARSPQACGRIPLRVVATSWIPGEIPTS
jgi:hypothetical protein